MRLPTRHAPSVLTILRIVLAAVFFVLFAIMRPAHVGWASIVFFVAAVTDWWDGYLARAWKAMTPLGAFLDPLADKLLTGAALLAFAWDGFVPMWMVVIVLVRDGYMTLLRTVGEALNLPVKTNYTAKVKTFAQMTFIVIVLALLLFDRVIVQSSLLVWPMAVITTVTVASALQYTYQNWAVLRALARRYLLRRPQQESI